MKVTYYLNNTIAVVAPVGRIDSETSPELEKKVMALFQRGDRYLILDLSSVTYLASNGMRVLLLIAKKCQTYEAKFALVGIAPFVRSVLEMTGFMQYFEEYENAEAAIDSIAAQSNH